MMNYRITYPVSKKQLEGYSVQHLLTYKNIVDVDVENVKHA